MLLFLALKIYFLKQKQRKRGPEYLLLVVVAVVAGVVVLWGSLAYAHHIDQCFSTFFQRTAYLLVVSVKKPNKLCFRRILTANQCVPAHRLRTTALDDKIPLCLFSFFCSFFFQTKKHSPSPPPFSIAHTHSHKHARKHTHTRTHKFLKLWK